MCSDRKQLQRICSNRFAGVTVLLVLAAVLTGRSETAATESFNGICVRIATARSTIRRARFSLTRRLHSVCGCSRFMRFSGLTRVQPTTVRNWSDTQNGPPAHRVLHQSTRCAFPRSRRTRRNRRGVRLCRKERSRARSRVALAWAVHAWARNI